MEKDTRDELIFLAIFIVVVGTVFYAVGIYGPEQDKQELEREAIEYDIRYFDAMGHKMTPRESYSNRFNIKADCTQEIVYISGTPFVDERTIEKYCGGG